jgi:hypothetical protein
VHRRTGFQFALGQIGQSFWLEKIDLSTDEGSVENVLQCIGKIRAVKDFVARHQTVQAAQGILSIALSAVASAPWHRKTLRAPSF